MLGVMPRREGKAFAGFVCRENSLSSMIQRDFAADLYAQAATGLVLARLANHRRNGSELAHYENHPGAGHIPGPVRG
jgi:hypothetical protein